MDRKSKLPLRAFSWPFVVQFALGVVLAAAVVLDGWEGAKAYLGPEMTFLSALEWIAFLAMLSFAGLWIWGFAASVPIYAAWRHFAHRRKPVGALALAAGVVLALGFLAWAYLAFARDDRAGSLWLVIVTLIVPVALTPLPWAIRDLRRGPQAEYSPPTLAGQLTAYVAILAAIVLVTLVLAG
jgi:hypothetical protein